MYGSTNPKKKKTIAPKSAASMKGKPQTDRDATMPIPWKNNVQKAQAKLVHRGK